MSPTASPRRGEAEAAASGAPETRAPALETLGLRKEYGRKVALHGLDLEVQAG